MIAPSRFQLARCKCIVTTSDSIGPSIHSVHLAMRRSDTHRSVRRTSVSPRPVTRVQGDDLVSRAGPRHDLHDVGEVVRLRPVPEDAHGLLGSGHGLVRHQPVAGRARLGRFTFGLASGAPRSGSQRVVSWRVRSSSRSLLSQSIRRRVAFNSASYGAVSWRSISSSASAAGGPVGRDELRRVGQAGRRRRRADPEQGRLGHAP
jgi:hypothetical protein